MSDVTRILDAINAGDSKAGSELLPLVYDELRKLAAARMAQEQPGQTLQPTALVHEAWLRLTANQSEHWNGRGHFFAAAAEAMRRILIDNARRKQAHKRGSGAIRVELDGLTIATETNDETLLAVNEALELLAVEDSSAAEVVKLRFFVGLSNEEVGRALGISERTVKRQWSFARAWLYDHLRRQETPLTS
jgi:RNA polymerase sigma factor (TIGR02999 family)